MLFGLPTQIQNIQKSGKSRDGEMGVSVAQSKYTQNLAHFTNVDNLIYGYKQCILYTL